MAAAADLTVTVRTALEEVVELIPRKIRTALYVAAVVVAALAFAAQRVVGIWMPELDTRVDATVADVVTAVLFLLGILGTAYRPTRTDGLLPPIVPDALDAAHIAEVRARTIDTLVHAGWTPDQAAAAVTENGRLIDTDDEPAHD